MVVCSVSGERYSADAIYSMFLSRVSLYRSGVSWTVMDVRRGRGVRECLCDVANNPNL